MMEQQPEMNQVIGEAKATLDVGSILRDARESMGISVEEVAGRLKFAPRQIAALEEGNFDLLPEMAFVRGFVRSYARLLQLDEAPLLDALPSMSAQSVFAEKKSAGEPFPNVYAMRKPNIIWLAAALVVALIIGILVWRYDGGPVEPKLAAPEVVNVPVVMPESAVPAAAPQAGIPVAVPAVAPKAVESTAHKRPARMLRLNFDDDSWVEVKGSDGKMLLSLMGVRGSEQSVNGTPPFALVIGNAKGVRLYYKGNPVDLAPHTKVDVARLTLE